MLFKYAFEWFPYTTYCISFKKWHYNSQNIKYVEKVSNRLMHETNPRVVVSDKKIILIKIFLWRTNLIKQFEAIRLSTLPFTTAKINTIMNNSETVKNKINERLIEILNEKMRIRD